MKWWNEAMTLNLEDLEMEVIIISKNFLLTHMCADFTCIRISGTTLWWKLFRVATWKRKKSITLLRRKKRSLDIFVFTYLNQSLSFSRIRRQNFLLWWQDGELTELQIFDLKFTLNAYFTYTKRLCFRFREKARHTYNMK